MNESTLHSETTDSVATCLYKLPKTSGHLDKMMDGLLEDLLPELD